MAGVNELRRTSLIEIREAGGGGVFTESTSKCVAKGSIHSKKRKHCRDIVAIEKKAKIMNGTVRDEASVSLSHRNALAQGDERESKGTSGTFADLLLKDPRNCSLQCVAKSATLNRNIRQNSTFEGERTETSSRNTTCPSKNDPGTAATAAPIAGRESEVPLRTNHSAMSTNGTYNVPYADSCIARDFSPLASANSTSHVLGAVAGSIDFWATRGPSFATLPGWLRELLCLPAFRQLCSVRRREVARSTRLGPKSCMIKIVQEWDELSDFQRKALHDQSQSPLLDQISKMRADFGRVRQSLAAIKKTSKRVDKEGYAWSADCQFGHLTRHIIDDAPGGLKFKKGGWEDFWKQVQRMYGKLKSGRMISATPGTKDAHRRGLLNDDVTSFLRSLVTTKSFDVPVAAKHAKTYPNEPSYEARRAIEEMLSKSIRSLDEQIETNRKRRASLRTRCLEWATKDSECSDHRRRASEETMLKWSQYKAWKSVRSSLLRGVVVKQPGFNLIKEKPPPSWRVRVKGRPSEEEVAATVPQAEESDTICAICFDGQSPEHNQIVFCERCDVGVHQACMGIRTIPDGDYFCDGCAYVEREEGEGLGQAVPRKVLKPQCCLCPVEGGALKPCKVGTHKDWVHVMCGLWHRDVDIVEVTTMSRIRVESQKHSDASACFECGKRASRDRLLRCSKGGCEVRFHPYCGWFSGYDMRVTRAPTKLSESDENDHIYGGLRFESYCPAHARGAFDQVVQQRIRAQYCQMRLPAALLDTLRTNGVTPGRRDSKLNGMVTCDVTSSEGGEETKSESRESDSGTESDSYSEIVSNQA